MIWTQRCWSCVQFSGSGMQGKNLQQRAASEIRSSSSTIALTGAGVSVESGLPDFRSSDGIWSRYDIYEYAYLDSFIRNPHKIWAFVDELLRSFGHAQPNPGHLALAELEKHRFLNGIITQNIDNLHQAAGSRHVVEFHGNLHRLVCLDCGGRFSMENEKVMANMPPVCTCGRILKPDFVFFGEMIPPTALEESLEMAGDCDVLLVIGTSAEVAPASLIPIEAKRKGAVIIELNLASTALTEQITDYFLQGSFAEVMPQLTRCVLDTDNCSDLH